MRENKQKPKILIVEDDTHNHELFREAYENEGFEVLIADTADGNFVEAVLGFMPDIISMDLMIGKKNVVVERDGFQAIDLLKEHNRARQIPIIVVSNFFEESKVKLAEAQGVIDYYNLQGQSITSVAKRFKEYIDDPKKYRPSHPLFREEE